MDENLKKNSDGGMLAHQLQERLTGSWMTQAIYVAAELRISDLLAEGPRRSEELAVATKTHESSLRRLLQALGTIDICREREDGSFEITPMGALLGTNHPQSLRSWILWWGHYLWPVWGNLLYSVRTGESARKLLGPTKGFGHLEGDAEAEAVFNQGIVELTRLEAQSVVRAYDFSGLKKIMDVGGGYGELLISILRSHSSIFGILFERSHAIEGATKHFEKSGLTDRNEFIEGDFFKSVPQGADAYLLKNILHNWTHEQGRQILESCHRAMSKDARLLIIERILPDRYQVSPIHKMLSREDLNMLVACGGQERTEAEFRGLLNSAGFKVSRILSTDTTLFIIEASPISSDR